jgi:hypothetical protein
MWSRVEGKIMMAWNIVGDLAGRFDELQLLLNKMPEGHIIAVGDLCDRGRQSAEVVSFLRGAVEKNQATILYGNHEDLLVDYYLQTGIYQWGTWLYNGGESTIDSFNGQVPDDVVSWLARRPLIHKIRDISIPSFPEGVLVSHSFVAPHLSLEQACEIAKRQGIRWDDYDFEQSIIWNRQPPIRREYFQICGHNSRYQEHSDNQGVYAICIDDCKNKKLTGLHLRDNGSYDLYTQD